VCLGGSGEEGYRCGTEICERAPSSTYPALVLLKTLAFAAVGVVVVLTTYKAGFIALVGAGLFATLQVVQGIVDWFLQ